MTQLTSEQAEQLRQLLFVLHDPVWLRRVVIFLVFVVSGTLFAWCSALGEALGFALDLFGRSKWGRRVAKWARDQAYLRERERRERERR